MNRKELAKLLIETATNLLHESSSDYTYKGYTLESNSKTGGRAGYDPDGKHIGNFDNEVDFRYHIDHEIDHEKELEK